MEEHQTICDSLANIKKISFSFIKQLREFLGSKNNWIPIDNKTDMAGLVDDTKLFYATYNGPGNNGKEPYVWLDIKYKGIDCSICTVWLDVDGASKNPHHYFGQICFEINITHRADACPSSNLGSTTIDDLLKRAEAFKAFLKADGRYKTVSQKSGRIPLTVDNVMNGKIAVSDVISLFELWIIKAVKN